MARVGEARPRLPASTAASKSNAIVAQPSARTGRERSVVEYSRFNYRWSGHSATAAPGKQEVGPMPAVTVDDLTTLGRLSEPGLADQPRRVLQVTTAPQGYEGEGFPVRRAFAGIDLSLLDPFIMMDQMGEVEYAPGEAKGTPWHPHRGFETVTYIIDGVFDHQDSHGGGGSITNGDTQWMTAGSGILHIETPPEWLVQSGGLFHGIQLWVNLPRDEKMVAPRYQDIRSGEVALLTSYDAGSLVRVIAGQVGPQAGPGSTHTPMALVHATIEPGARLELPWNNEFNALVYVLNGRGTIGTDARPIHSGQSAVLGAGDYVTLAADGSQESRSPKLDVIVVGGKPIGQALAWAGPFVMNTKAEVLQAYEDFQKGRFGHIPG
jgi:quercetin 2,3-dioxygenase